VLPLLTSTRFSSAAFANGVRPTEQNLHGRLHADIFELRESALGERRQKILFQQIQGLRA
jgi:hypothetical protein